MGSAPQPEDLLSAPVGRRAVVAGAGAVAAAAALAAAEGCATYGKPAAPATTAGSAAAGGGTPIAKTADIPVGSGKILGDTVVTQATAGKFAAFSSTCTHQGCTVDDISGGTINCPCHGSKYKLDGSVAQGPATRPLPGKSVTVQSESIFVT